MNARYILLIQKQFDEDLSERETYELQGFLAGNESAKKLSEHVRMVIDECAQMDIPENLKPEDAEHLLTKILSGLCESRSQSWLAALKSFVQTKPWKPQTEMAQTDELSILRSKRKVKTDNQTVKAIDSIRLRVGAESMPMTPPNAVSLAEAIKQRMFHSDAVSDPTPIKSSTPQHQDWQQENLHQKSEAQFEQRTFVDSHHMKQQAPQISLVKSQHIEQQSTQDRLLKSQQTDKQPTREELIKFQHTDKQSTREEQINSQHMDEQSGSLVNPQHINEQSVPAPLIESQPTNEQITPLSLVNSKHINEQSHQIMFVDYRPVEKRSEPTFVNSQSIDESMDQIFNSATNWPAQPTPPTWQNKSSEPPVSPEPTAPPAAQPCFRANPTAPPNTPQPVFSSKPPDLGSPDFSFATPHFAASLPEPDFTAEAILEWELVEPNFNRLSPINSNNLESAPTPAAPKNTGDSWNLSNSIPVDEIIAHVSAIFAERYPVKSRGDDMDDPLAISGAFPKVREEDLKLANTARLGTTSNTVEHNGKISSLGRFLLDKNSEAAIGALEFGNPNLSQARVLSREEVRELEECLAPIESQDGVAGCVILGYDGMLITSSLPAHADKDAFCAWALLTYMNCHDLVKILGHKNLRQLVSRTENGYLLLADFGQGLLVAVSENATTDAIIPLMKSVRRITAA